MPKKVSHRRAQTKQNFSVAYACATAGLAAGLSVITVRFGREQFGGMDGGVLASAAWMLHLGYTPYVDFWGPLPPLFYLGAKWAFALFGAQWMALANWAAVFHGALFVTQVALLREAGARRPWALGTAIASLCVTSVPLGGWWYNQMSAAVAALAVCAFMALERRPSLFATLSCTASVALLTLSKPNVAGWYLAGGALIFARAETQTRSLAARATAAGLVLALGLLFFTSTPIAALLKGYLEASSRARSPDHWLRFLWFNDHWEAWKSLAYLAPLLAALAWRRAYTPWAWLGLSGAVVAAATNNDHNMVELPPLLSAAAVAIAAPGPDRRLARAGSSALLALSLALLAGFGLRIGHKRYRIRSVGEGMYFENGKTEPVPGVDFFAGMKVSMALTHTVSDIRETLAKARLLEQRDARVFFGPRVEFAYPAFHFTPPKGVPLWWEFHGAGTRSTAVIQSVFKEGDGATPVDRPFDLLIFRRDDFTFFPETLKSLLFSRYSIETTRRLTILHPR